MASRLVLIKSVEEFRRLHEAGLARFVLRNGIVDEPTIPEWSRRSDVVVEDALSLRRLVYYVEQDEG